MSKQIVKHYSLGKKRKLTLVCRKTNNTRTRFSAKEKTSIIEIGHAVSNPDDKFDKNVGELIATNRLEHPNGLIFYIAEIEAKFMSETFILAQMLAVADFVKDNLHVVIKGYK